MKLTKINSIKVIRTISTSELRQVCIDNQYYTRGTSEEYHELLNMVGMYNHPIELTQDLLNEITLNIFNHSDVESIMGTYNVDVNELVESIMFNVLDRSRYIVKDVSVE